MLAFNWQRELGREGHRVIFSGQAFAMHCHHYNINLQKTMEDTLGPQGVELLVRSAEQACFDNFAYLLAQYSQLKSLKSKIEMAATMFQNCGLGILHFQHIGLQGGQVVSPSSHHVTGWLAKHGRRATPGCHFTRGWLAGMMAAVFGQAPGSFDVEERECKLMRHRDCVFTITGTSG